jgi:hypothetical protein
MKLLAILAIGAVALLGARAYLSQAGSTPAGQPPLVELAALDRLKAEFNRAAGGTRVILLIAPSCPFCLKGASGVQRLLEKHAARKAAVFVVWEPILPTDWGKPGGGVLGRMGDRRVRQYWDPAHLVAAELKRSAESPNLEPDCCVRNGVWWDLMASFAPGAQWGASLPEPAVLKGTVEDALPRLESLLEKAL